jgi:hypothetical protein
MKTRGLFGAATIAAAGAAVLWAYGLTVLQPLAERAGYAENNTYWARDMRCAALLAGLGVLIALGRGGRRPAAYPVIAGLVWFGADLALDRAQITAFVPTAVGAVLAVTAAAVAGVRHRPAPRRRVLTTVAAICAAAAPMAALLESPTDAEPQLAPTRLLAAALLVVAALACALVAGPAVSARRLLAAVAVLAPAVAGLVLVPGNMAVGVGVGGGLLTAAWLLSRAWPGWSRAGGVALASLAAYPMLVMVLVLFQIVLPVGAIFTALAGSPPVNAADSDVLYVLAGVLTGLGFAGASRVADRLRPTPALDSGYVPAVGWSTPGHP